MLLHYRKIVNTEKLSMYSVTAFYILTWKSKKTSMLVQYHSSINIESLFIKLHNTQSIIPKQEKLNRNTHSFSNTILKALK